MDWDEAYDNRAHVGNADEIIARWNENAARYRSSMISAKQCELDLPYGDNEREKIDVFYPKAEQKGLVIFVHGGYWRALDKSCFSDLAAGPVSHGWAVALVQYTLAPQIRISGITRQVRRAIEKSAQLVEGPLRLIGHSAGGHLVVRMLCSDMALPASLMERVAHTVAVSGLNDLSPLLHTQMNADLRLDEDEVRSESPVFLQPAASGYLTCWAGADELPEFVRQNGLLKQYWGGSELEIGTREEPGKNHFSVIEDLTNPNSGLTKTLLETGA